MHSLYFGSLPATVCLGVLLAFAPVSNVRAADADTSFTYQGFLRTLTGATDGLHDFRFVLYTASEDGESVGAPVDRVGVEVSEGRFTVPVDFGIEVFEQPDLWLEISLRPHDAELEFNRLVPRQKITPVPYALQARRAGHAAQADLALALPPGAVTGANLAEATITVDRLAPDQVVTSLNGLRDAVEVVAGPHSTVSASGQTLTITGSADWRLDGNSGTTSGTHFLGTTDAQPLELRVNGAAALRLLPTSNPGAVNILGGSRGNFIKPDLFGVTIAGGGASLGVDADYTNSVHAQFGTIGGGWANFIGTNAASSVINGGLSNRIDYFAHEAVIGGGFLNQVTEGSWQSVIGGGANNRVEVTGHVATISGGSSNIAGSYYTTIGGGARNGIFNNARYATIGGGGDNFIRENSFSSVIGGGGDNQVLESSERSTIGGGKFNQIGAFSPHATIGGGFTNTIGSNAEAAIIPGGSGNRVTSPFALAAGRRAHGLHPGSFVWGDSSNTDFSSTAANEWSVRAVGGVRFVTAIDAEGAPTSGVGLAAGAGSWDSLSDREAKENFDEISSREILERLLELPIRTWNYKAQAPEIRHIGPTAQEFKAAFNLGTDPRRITTIDADGVALAAIQGLHEIVAEKDERIRALEQRLDHLESLLMNGLEARQRE
jgi:trimeric autotransporter adhesin